MHVPGEVVNQVFDPLVGSPATAEALKGYLVSVVRGEGVGEQFASPYRRLEAGAVSALQDAISGPQESRIDSRYKYTLGTNGENGIQLTVSTMKALGTIYRHTVEKPQDLLRVQKNASTALRHTYGAAHNGRVVGLANVWANALGLSPRNPAVWAAISCSAFMYMPEVKPGFTIKGVSPEAFKPEVDDAGQLTITPRHKRIGKLRDRACPATQARVATHEGVRSGLLTFMKTIGGVAIDEIYARDFDIRTCDQ